MCRTFLALGVVTIALVLGPAPVYAHDCTPAGGTIDVRASVAGADVRSVTYTVVNRTRDRVRWLSIGAGGAQHTPVVPQQTPVIAAAPRGWRGTVVYPEETSSMHLWWEAEEDRAALPPGGSSEGFAIRVAGPGAVSPGLRGMDGRPVTPIDFAALPFTVGGSDGRCWWGRVGR